MAHRIQMKLGVAPEAERAPDSPDTVLHVEPRIGAQTRTKGHLYLLVTSRVAGPRAREATRLVADAIRSEYYYDESAGIRVCLVKAVQAANKRLSHSRERAGLGNGRGPIGVGLAVVRDNELYVCTVGPAEAYLNRGARLSTLPDPYRDRGLPSDDLDPDVWRGEINVGDELLLVSPNVVAALGGVDQLKDALITLHPQSAVEHLQRQFQAAGASGSDGALVIEAGEVSASRAGFAPVPVKPAEPLAGVPDRSPIPLADSVADGFAAAQSGARRARGAAGGALAQLLFRIQDTLPFKPPASRRVTPISARRELQRRAAMAILSLVVVVGGLGAGVFFLGGHVPSGPVIASVDAGQQALELARTDVQRVMGSGVDLVDSDPSHAEQLLADALTQLDAAEAAGVPTTTTGPIRTQAVGALDRLYKVVDVVSSTVFQFPADQEADLAALVHGPDGAPYVLDNASASVYRIDLENGKATAVYKSGSKVAGGTEAAPVLLGVGARDLLIVDARDTVWRWQPANQQGKGTTTRVGVKGASEWGNDVVAIGTFVRDSEAGLYNLYVVDPSQQQILAYDPAADGSGFPSSAQPRLATPRDVSDVTDLYIDGDIWLAEAGQIERIVGGKADGWTAASPGDEILRTPPAYRLIDSASDRRQGVLYGFDVANQRVIALDKASGTYLQQYRLANDDPAWSDLRDFYVDPGLSGEPDAILWIDATGLHRTVLEAVAVAPTGSGEPSPSPTTAPTPTPKPTPTAKPKK